MTRPWDNGIDLSQVQRKVLSHASHGLELAAAEVLATSQQDVPYLSRDLMKSGDSGLVDGRTAAVTYRDSKAVAVHENLTDHRRHGRSAKFLENAFNSSRARVLDLLAREARRGLE